MNGCTLGYLYALATSLQYLKYVICTINHKFYALKKYMEEVLNGSINATLEMLLTYPDRDRSNLDRKKLKVLFLPYVTTGVD